MSLFLSLNAVALMVATATQVWHKDPMLGEGYMKDLDTVHHHSKAASLAVTVPAKLLPGSHELVDKALSEMPVQTRELQQKQAAVNQAQGKLRGSVNEATAHLSDAAEIKHAIADKEAQLREIDKKQHNLQDDSSQIEGAHSALVSSVHEVHDPNVEKAQMRLENKEAILKKEQESTKYLADQRQQTQAETTEALNEEDQAKSKLSEAKAETTADLKQEDAAERKAVYDQQMATEEAQSLKYAESQESNEKSRLEAAEKVEAEVVKKMQGRTDMRSMEQVEDAQRAKRAEKDELDNWQTNKEHISEQAAETLSQSTLSHDHLVEVQGEVAKAKQQQAEAEKQYKLKEALAIKETRALKYVSTKHAAEAAKTKVAEAAAKAADVSLQKLNSIRDSEEQKVHSYLAKGKDKIQNKVQKWEAVRAKTSSEIDALQQKYKSWQDEQLKREKQVEETQQESAQASQEYAADQREAFAKAQLKVEHHRHAEKGSHFVDEESL